MAQSDCTSSEIFFQMLIFSVQFDYNEFMQLIVNIVNYSKSSEFTTSFLIKKSLYAHATFIKKLFWHKLQTSHRIVTTKTLSTRSAIAGSIKLYEVLSPPMETKSLGKSTALKAGKVMKSLIRQLYNE